MKNSSLNYNPQRRALASSLDNLRWTAGALLLGGIAASGAISPSAQAQETRRGSSAIMLEEVVVTARKREEQSQDVPLSVTAFGSDQIEALKIRDLTNLSVGMPNVALDDVGTTRGTANFSIRGLGINSSIPSIDPTVGVVVDGVYMGLNAGILFDTFDLQSIEVLRGPQGTLFGRNVTGGAVLINTKKPAEEFELTVRAAVDTGNKGGLNNYLMGSVGGPVTDWMGAKLTAYYNDDNGYLENDFSGDDLGKIEQKMFRPVVVVRPSDTTELVLRYEYSETDGDGAVGQSHTNGSGQPGTPVNHNRNTFHLSIDESGFQKSETNFFSAELNWDVAFGDGTVTNIFGWRDYEATALGDIDSQPVWLFHAPSWLESEQYSNELRYNGLFADRANVTVGAYWFTNDMLYHERRNLLGVLTGGVAPASVFDGGGDYQVDTWALFAALDYDLTEDWVLTLGLRYTQEEKSAKVASLIFNNNRPCNVVVSQDCPFDFVDDDSWESLSPKVGFTYLISDDARIYGHWTQGTRSGGYNLRNTSPNPADTPGPFDDENVDSFEVGLKSEASWGRLNAALFYNQIEDMQRELNFPGPAGVIQLVRNTADADILGLEIDGTFAIGDNLVAIASVGWIDAEYTDVLFDLNGDGVINGVDEGLDLPRAAEWTYSLGLTHDMDIGDAGYLTSRISYAYRDESAYTDDNRGYITEQDIVDLGFDFYTAGGNWVFSVYGRNMLDEVKHGGDTQLEFIGPVFVGGTFSPLSKGRRYGFEVTYNL